MSEPRTDPLAGPPPDPADMRRSYHRGHLEDGTLPGSWLPLFADWFATAAGELSLIEANAMQVATVDADGRPSVRTVLLKGFDERGWVFYTNYDSAKGTDLASRPYAAAVLAWVPLERQVRLRGPVSRVHARRDRGVLRQPPTRLAGRAPGRRRSRRSSRREPTWTRQRPRSSGVSTPARSRRHRTGAATASRRRRSSSGRAGTTGSTTGSATGATDERGCSSDSLRNG